MIEIGFVKGFGRIWKEFKPSKLICSMTYGGAAGANSQPFLKRETLLNQPQSTMKRLHCPRCSRSFHSLRYDKASLKLDLTLFPV
jgi:hypothetical protein